MSEQAERTGRRWRIWMVREGKRVMVWVDGIVTETWATKITEGANKMAQQLGKGTRYEMEEMPR